jgi:hypothetical protein
MTGAPISSADYVISPAMAGSRASTPLANELHNDAVVLRDVLLGR